MGFMLPLLPVLVCKLNGQNGKLKTKWKKNQNKTGSVYDAQKIQPRSLSEDCLVS